MGEIQPHIELDLVIPGFHVHAQLVKRLVMVAHSQVSQFMHDDHPQELRWSHPKQRCDPDFPVALEPATLDPRPCGVQAKRLLNQMNLAVEQYLVDPVGTAQMLLLQPVHVLVQSPVISNIVNSRVPFAKMFSQGRVIDQAPHLRLKIKRIGCDVTQRGAWESLASGRTRPGGRRASDHHWRSVQMPGPAAAAPMPGATRAAGRLAEFQ